MAIWTANIEWDWYTDGRFWSLGTYNSAASSTTRLVYNISDGKFTYLNGTNMHVKRG